MLKSRVIPVLLLQNGRMVKGRQFTDFRDTGDPVSASKVYNHQDADELVFIDIEASRAGARKDREVLYRIIENVSVVCFMPLCVGGGVDSVDDVIRLIRIGADKVLINTAAFDDPSLVHEASLAVGSQSIVVGIDVKKIGGRYVVHTHCGQVPRPELDLVSCVRLMEASGAGEIFINSIDRDGMMEGYDLELLKQVRAQTDLPVIACGGAGHFRHLYEALIDAKADAVACASMFHFGDNSPLRAKAFLKNQGVMLKIV